MDASGSGCYSSRMETATLTPEHQQLRALLEQYSVISTELPNLKAEEPGGWGAQLQAWFQQVVATWWEWLKAFLGPLPTTPVQIDWPVVLWSLFWICVVLLLFWLTYALAKKYLQQQHPQGPQAGLLTRMDSAEELLGKQLNAAVQDESWGLATRLRWRLFLCRMRCQSHATPNEFFCAPPYRCRWEQLHGTPVSEQYRVMFSATDASRQWFEHYHRGLTDLEGAHRHA